MQHFPIYVNLRGERIIVSGAGETAAAKLRLLLKTEADITVVGSEPIEQIITWAEAGRIVLVRRDIEAADAQGARLLYAANDDPAKDAIAADIGRNAGALFNIVDNIADSQFITPALVDRDPVAIAIGTEGAAPVLARRLKADIEEQVPPLVGQLARIGKAFRPAAAALPNGAIRRAFWADYYERVGPQAWQQGGEPAVNRALEDLLRSHLAADDEMTGTSVGRVCLIGAGPGDPELLTHKARRLLHEADVVIYDRLVSEAVLELARREAMFLEVGKAPGGASWAQDDINALIIKHAKEGAVVARLKSGDPTIYGRLDEEMDALDAAGIAFEIVPGVTSALAAASRLKVSLTRRERNSELRLITGQDVKGFAEHDWRTLARPGAVAAIYMGVRAVRFLQARLLMHGAAPDTPITAIENVSRANERVVSTTIARMERDCQDAKVRGPAIIFLGLEPREARVAYDGTQPAFAEAL